MRNRPAHRSGASLVLIGLLVVSACSGGTSPPDSAAPTGNANPGTTPAVDASPTGAGEPATDVPSAEATLPPVDLPPAAPGTGRLDLGSRVFEIELSECTFQDGGTVTAEGETSEGFPFEFLQFYLNGAWSQSQVQVDTGPTVIHVIRSSAAAGAQPATVDGTRITWTEEFRELDVAQNAFIFSGQGSLNLTCP